MEVVTKHLPSGHGLLGNERVLCSFQMLYCVTKAQLVKNALSWKNTGSLISTSVCMSSMTFLSSFCSSKAKIAALW